MRPGELEYRHEAQYRASRVAALDPFDGRIITGMPIVFNSSSENLGGFIERIRPNAIKRTLKEGIDVLALLEHDIHKLLGRVSAGTLVLRAEAAGLINRIDPPDTSYARDAVKLIERRDLKGQSFGFKVLEDEWHMEDGIPVREIEDMIVREVTLTAVPAYQETDVAVAKRSLLSFVQKSGAAITLATRERILRQLRAS